jgi:hypothetical protein
MVLAKNIKRKPFNKNKNKKLRKPREVLGLRETDILG